MTIARDHEAREDNPHYHGSGCPHPYCRNETAWRAKLLAENRRRHERPRTRIEFNPLAVRFTW